ncbi:MAG: glycoside hydrolase family 38 C-terminal domain-containing protein [Bacillota bacterium]
MKKMHLICNAHLDPVWLWEVEEGIAEAISTFRVAADFCEEFDGFIFNHNEVILYKWIEEYEPALFARIQKLVAEGKWHIMGGWFLQPDCNMPSGESFIRQILAGRIYFNEKFGVQPSTAINFDPFGHTQGLVQILKKCGYDSYIFCRPFIELPAEDFTWVGYDGSKIIGHRSIEWYNSELGTAKKKVEEWVEKFSEKATALVLWGIGNHGGGPSKIDLTQIKELMESKKDVEILHSTPEAYFKELKELEVPLPEVDRDLNPWAPGCYTSQIRIKQLHRLLENETYMLEKIMSVASLQGLLTYPVQEFKDIFCDLLTAEFHDILPGSSIQPVEERALRTLGRAIETCMQLKAKAFFAFASGQEKAKEGEIPILIYNPHPYKVKGVFECEFNLQIQNREVFSMPEIYSNDQKLPTQVEKELSNLNFDWRKRAVFSAELAPNSMNRFDCRIRNLPQKPSYELKSINDKISFMTDALEVIINCKTGLIDTCKINGFDYLKANAFLPIVIQDNEDPWGSNVYSFPYKVGEFKLMSAEKGTRFSGVSQGRLESVRVIEDGEVRAVVEAVLEYGNSTICLQYKLPKSSTEIEIDVRVFWNEKDKMLKLSIPTRFENAKYLGQVAFGVSELPSDRTEAVSQKWLGVQDEKQDKMFTIVNDCIYGSDYLDGEIRLSLLRSSAYSALQIDDRPLVPQDRFLPRIDQGERKHTFWLNGGPLAERALAIDREALAHNEKPFVLSFFPSGNGVKPEPFVFLNDEVVQMTCFKKAEGTEDYIIRLFEPTGAPRSTVLDIPSLGIKEKIELGKFEVKTLKLNSSKKSLEEVNMLEK